MKVILIKKLRNLANEIGDVMNVKSGYARNYLIPKGFAIVCSSKNMVSFERKKQELEEENKRRILEAREIQDKIGDKKLVILSQASDEGRLYGKVSSVIIANKINGLLQNDLVKSSNVVVPYPIKEVGAHPVIINLHPEVSFEIILITARTIEEAESLGKSKEEQGKTEVV